MTPSGSAADALDLELAELEPSDTGNAHRLLRRFGQDLLWSAAGGWYVWTGRHWQRDDNNQAIRLAQETTRLIHRECVHLPSQEQQQARAKWAVRSQNRAQILGMLEMAAPHLAIRADEFDPNPWVLNVANGTIDLRDGDVTGHRREDRITRLIPIPYAPGARCPTWLRFLDEIFGANPDAEACPGEGLPGFLQRAVGYCLTGDTREQALFLLHGRGANGKSTLLEVLRALLGDYAQQTPTETFMTKDRAGGIPNDLARLAGARFVSAVESESGRRLAEGLIKQATGGDPITARFLHREYFEFQPQFKLWLATNHKPEIRGGDDGIWRRIRLIPFDVQFADPERASPGQPVKDRTLLSRLLDGAEMQGILYWAVQGCLEWQRTGLREPAEVLEATASYREEMDQLGDYIAERCELAPRYCIRAGELYRDYETWCQANGLSPLSAKAFGARLTERGLPAARGIHGRMRQGIDLQEQFKQSPARRGIDA